MRRPRVLVVEDRPSVLALMQAILEDAYEVVTAPDAARAVALLGAEPLDVVLTDVRMPGASGFEVLRAVRDRAPTTSVVLMTAYANVPDAVAAIRLGAFDYVAKPLDADEIALVVARAVEHGRAAAACEAPEPPPSAPAEAARPGEPPPEVPVGFHRAVEQARERASRQYLEDLVRQFHGNVTQAATRAGMTRESLHRVLKRYGVDAERHRDEPIAAGRPPRS